MRYVIYTRVSGKKQTTENQVKECRDYVNKILQKGDEIVEFSEPDLSTRKPMNQRKKLMEMMTRLRKGDQLVVYKVDRLARHPQELINIYCDITNLGIEIVGLNDPHLNLQTICIYAFIACTERENIQVRTKSGLKRKKSNMERVGAVTYGYSLDETKLSEYKDAKSEGKPYLLIPNEKEQKQINIMIDLYEKDFSYQQIVNELKDQGYRNRNGKVIQKTSVWRILGRLGKRRPSPMAALSA